MKTIIAKTILNKHKKRDTWFLDNYSVNPYQSCSFNCLYCYIRGSKYGSNLAQSLTVKENAVTLLDKQLANRAKKRQYGFIVLSSTTDPYIPIEEELKITRQLLEVILRYRFPVHIITKSTLVKRDLDLIQQINEKAYLPDDLKDSCPYGAFVTFSLSSIDEDIAKQFESGAPKPIERLETMQFFAENGIHTGVSLMPLLPYISDTNEALDSTFELVKQYKAKYVLPASITLFGNQPSDSKTLVFNKVKKQYPHLHQQYLDLFSNKIKLEGYKKEVKQRADAIAHKFGLKTSIL